MSNAVPLRRRLLLVAAAGIVPLSVAVGGGLLLVAHDERDAAQASSLDFARMSGAAIDLEIERSKAILGSIAAATALDDGESQDIQPMLERVLESTPSWYAITLATPDRRPVVHVVEPEGEFVSDGVETFSHVVQARQPIVGYLARDADGRWGVPLRVPVMRGDELRYVLTAVIKPEAIRSVLLAQRLPPDLLVSVFDARGNRVARTLNHEETIGGLAAPSLAQLIKEGGEEGHGLTQSIEGMSIATAFRKLPLSGWTIAVGSPAAAVQAAAMQKLKVYGAAVLCSLLLASLATWIAARSINQPMHRLRKAVEQIGRGEVPQLQPSGVREIEEVGQALLVAVQRHRNIESARAATLRDLVSARAGLRQQVADLQRLHALSSDLLKEATLDGQLHAVLAALCELHESRCGSISLVDTQANCLRSNNLFGFPEAAHRHLSCIRPGEGACGLTMLTGRRTVIANADTHPLYAGLHSTFRDLGVRGMHSTPIRSNIGRVLGVVAVSLGDSRYPTPREQQLADLCAHLCAQVVERMLADRAASHSEQRLHVALDSASVPFSILSPVRDGRGVIIDFVWDYLNLAAAEVLQRPATDVVARRMRDLTGAPWSDHAMFDAYVKVVESGCVRNWEQSAISNGKRQWLHVVATPFDQNLAVWWSDITKRKLQEERLQEADRRKDEFIAILAHELRNPLAPIQQAARVARSDTATEKQRSWSHEVIDRQVRQMTELLDDLLDISRITRGKLKLKRSSVDLRGIVDSALETAQPHLDAKRHTLTLDLPQHRVLVEADPIRLAQVITNLLTNAARYTAEGGAITLAAVADGGHAVVRVQDNGIGIPAKHLETIFEMFSQVESKHTSPNSGLGIGLAFSRAIVDLHGGTLTARSAGPGRGSCFEIRLPRAAAPEVPLRIVRRSPARDRLRIIVADDNRDAADTLASLLQLEGYDTVVAYDGESACELFESLRADVVLLDIGMPRLNGYEAASRIRASVADLHPSPLLVALTGWGKDKDIDDAMRAGFDRHLVKPVDPDTLLQMIDRFRRGERPTEQTA